MRVTLRTTALVAFFCLGQLADARLVHAYCRTTTVPLPADKSCMCSDTGHPFYWEDETIEYAFNERGFPGVSDASLRQVFARSFANWSDVLCDGEPVALSVRAAAQATSETLANPPDDPAKNVIAHQSEAEFLRPDRDPFAFALTHVAYDANTGRIIDVDILFNEGMGPYAVCPENGCGGSAVDLENVATHEIGHLFGLAHSPDKTATMACTADRKDIEKRSLGPDDIAGICAIYGPDAIEERAAALTNRRVPAGCACDLSPDPRRGAPLGALAAACSALLLARLRRRRH